MAFADTAGLIAGGVSAVAKAVSGFQKSENLQVQAELADLRASQERLRGAQQVASLREDLLYNLAANRAASAASGIAMDSPTVQRTLTESRRSFAERAALLRNNAEIRATTQEATGTQLRSRAESAETVGLLSAASTLAGTAGRAGRRGDVPEAASPSNFPTATPSGPGGLLSVTGPKRR